uniref:Uncharacterized protein n=1 Tax=Anguilla anguilla TaxID=7936 RepID=A0A0E9PQ23_ANGAN
MINHAAARGRTCIHILTFVISIRISVVIASRCAR